MKKLLLLMLVLLGGFGTASAERNQSATIYIKAAEAPQIHLWDNDGNITTWGSLPTMSQTTLNGIAVYKYDVTFAGKYNFLVKSNTAQSSNVNNQTTTVYYSWDGKASAPSYRGINWVVAGSRALTNNYEEWAGTSSNNKMTTTDDETFTLTVTSRPLKAGVTYKYKVVGDGTTWLPGSDKEIMVDADGLYDITFTYKRTGNAVSNTTPTSVQSGTISYKYYVYDNDASLWSGITAFTGKTWPECEMTNVNGTYVYGIEGKALTSGNRYGSRFVEEHYIDDTKVGTAWLYVSDSDGGSQGCRYYDCTADGTYNIVLSYTPGNTFSVNGNQPKVSVTTGLYAANSDNWSSGYEMDFDATNGVYKYTFENINNKYFVLSKNANVTSNWNTYAIRPANGSGGYNINAFNTFSGTGYVGGNQSWYLTGDDLNNVEISFRPTDYYWAVTPYRTATIGKALYATWSNGEKYTVSGAEKIYTVGANKTNSVTLTEQPASTVFPANEGILVKGKENDVVKFYAVASTTAPTTIGTNYLVGTGNSETEVTVPNPNTTIYVFSWDGTDPATVGFYKAEATGNLAAHKAYLDLSRSSFNAREDFLSFNFGEEETDGIDAAKVNVISGTAYNLAGQKVGAEYKGIVIVNGKKVVRK